MSILIFLGIVFLLGALVLLYEMYQLLKEAQDTSDRVRELMEKNERETRYRCHCNPFKKGEDK